MRRALGIFLVTIAVALALALLGILALTNTNWGREHVRRIAVGALGGSVHGIVRLGKIRGNLLNEVILVDFSITDSAGRPFVSMERARAQYRLGDFLHKRIGLTSLALERPVITLDKPPGGEWNFQRIFPPTAEADTARGFGSWITANNVRITHGRVIVRTPWSPSDTLSDAQRDSAVRVALGGETRAHVVQVSGGYQSVMDFQNIQAALPHARLADPDSASRLFRVGELRMLAFPFTPPAADIRRLKGDFRMDADSLWFHDVAAALPNTRMSASGTYMLESGDLNLTTRARPLALADLRWLYPSLPSSGGGEMRFDMRYRTTTESDFVVRDASITVDSGSLSGAIGVAMDTAGVLRLHDTDLSFARVKTGTIEDLVPGLDIPRDGTLAGHAILAGGLSAMHVNADVAFDDDSDGTSRMLAVGSVGTGGPGGGINTSDLRLRFDPLQLALARVAAPELPVGGTIIGTATLNGSTTSRMMAQAQFVHSDRGSVSRIRARAAYEGGPRKWVDADVSAEPLALATAGRFAPALKLHGTVVGRVRATGRLDSLSVLGDLRLPDGGTLTARGWTDVESAEKRYDLTAALDVFNLRTVTELGPPTAISAIAAVRGEGIDPATMRAAIAADVSHSAVDSVPFDSLSVRVAVANGVATIDTLSLAAPIANASASGAFGLASGRSGTLTYIVHVDSLAGLRRFIPSADTGVVAPRPGRVAAALEKARADSAREAQRTEVARAAVGGPPPKLHLDTIPALAADSISGAVYAAGKVTGGIKGFNVRGRLGVEKLIARGNVVRRGKVEYALVAAGTPSFAAAAGASLDSVEAAGFALDSVELRATYRKPGGMVDMAIYQDTGASYNVKSDYALSLDSNEVRIRDMMLRFGATRWSTVRPSAIQWGKRGVQVHALELRDGADGRLYVNGTIPTEGTADLDVSVDGLQIANIVGLLQSDVSATGSIVLDAHLAGTRAAPVLRGAMGVANVNYMGSPLPDLRTTFEYANTQLDAHAELTRGESHPLASLDAMVPVNLAFTGPTGDRLLDQPMRVNFVADSLPLDALPRFTDAVSEVRGRVIGAVAARGTPRNPLLAGRLDMDFASFRVVPMGVTLEDITGTIRLLGDSIAIDTLHGKAGAGSIVLGGSVGIKEATKPSFALKITGRNALVLDTEQGQIFASADITVKGPFDSIGVDGSARILNGVIYIPETGQQGVMPLDDPVAYRFVTDSAQAVETGLLPQVSPLMENLAVNVALTVNRDTWVRSSEANVEIYSPEELMVHLNPAQRAITIEGVVNTDRGDYTYLGRRFILSRGSVTFTGDPELNPLLQISAARNIELAGRGALEIGIGIGGTLLQPKITLQSDAQPPISQSDLLSYLAFGQSSSSLLQTGGTSGVSGGADGGSSLTGQAAGLAARQLATVAVDVLAKDLQANVGRSLGADVFNITPADIPPELALNKIETLLAGTQ
ncbi:MAG TPA: translocation/assembly module TamB domain-containing protein, partial [Gemmatimonadaceae bacterium]